MTKTKRKKPRTLYLTISYHVCPVPGPILGTLLILSHLILTATEEAGTVIITFLQKREMKTEVSDLPVVTQTQRVLYCV